MNMIIYIIGSVTSLFNSYLTVSTCDRVGEQINKNINNAVASQKTFDELIVFGFYWDRN